jgi:hypothetical protein
MENSLKKEAAEAIRILREDLNELQEKVASMSEARELLLSLYKEGSLTAEDALEQLETYETKDKDELEVIKKAIELNGTSKDYVFGTLSDRFQDDGSLDPITRMLLED